MDFCDKVWQKPNTEISWTVRQISDCSCRLLYQISNWCVHQNSLIGHAEKVTHNDLYCFIDWLNQQWLLFFVYWPTSKKKKKKEREEPTVYIPFFIYFAYIANSKRGVRFREIFQSGKGFHRRKSLKSTDLDRSLISNAFFTQATGDPGTHTQVAWQDTRRSDVTGHAWISTTNFPHQTHSLYSFWALLWLAWTLS